jgi:hypothetical protein
MLSDMMTMSNFGVLDDRMTEIEERLDERQFPFGAHEIPSPQPWATGLGTQSLLTDRLTA